MKCNSLRAVAVEAVLVSGFLWAVLDWGLWLSSQFSNQLPVRPHG